MIYFFLAIGALIAGIVTAMAGGGGIFIITFLMMLEIPIKIVIGTNRVSACLDNATSSYNYYKKGKLDTEFFKYAIIPAFLGTVIGSKLLVLLNAKIVERLIPMILLALVIRMFVNKKAGLENEFEGFTRKNIIKGIIVTFLMGIYMGFFGLAIGNFFTLALVYVLKFDFLKAVATVKPINFFMGLVSVVIYAMDGIIDWKIAIFVTAFRVIGSKLGSNYASEKGAKAVKPIFLLLCVFTVFKEYFL